MQDPAAGCIDTDLSADRRIFGRLDKTLMETTNAHHATWIKFTETHCLQVNFGEFIF
jgi:hypothetical protein